MSNEETFRRIVLATDGSEQSEAAVAVAASFARAAGAIVRVAHVWSLEVHHRHGVWDVEMRSEADRLITDAVNRLRALGVDADGELSRADNNHVAAAIAEVARGFNADLVVIGSRGLTDWQSIVQHGVSHNVLSALDCPVLIVRGALDTAIYEPKRVLVAVAGGEDVARTMHAAIEVAAAAGSKVRVLHVAQTVFGAQGFAYVEPQEEIDATIKVAADMLRGAGIDGEALVAETGPVAKVVAQAAASWPADLIVIGSSRMSDLPGLLLGSVTHDLLRATDRPVLVAERVHA